MDQRSYSAEKDPQQSCSHSDTGQTTLLITHRHNCRGLSSSTIQYDNNNYIYDQIKICLTPSVQYSKPLQSQQGIKPGCNGPELRHNGYYNFTMFFSTLIFNDGRVGVPVVLG